MNPIKLLLTFSVLFFNADEICSQCNKSGKPPLSLCISETGEFIIDTVIEVSQTTKSELYKRAKEWVVANSRTSDNTTFLDEVNNNEIRSDVSIPVGGKYIAAFVNTKISISIKENKCKIIFNSFLFQKLGKGTLYEERFNRINIAGEKAYYKEFDERFFELLKSLYTSMSKKTKEDW